MANKKSKIQPAISEKSYALANAENTYMFSVPVGMNKIEIGREVEKAYKVKVEKVNTVTKPGKMKRNYSTNKFNRREDQKKAYVTLKQGDKINEFFNI